MDRCNILAHRGVWGSKEEQNSRSAIKHALAGGFGIETDIRDHDGQVVLSHDVPCTMTVTSSAIQSFWKCWKMPMSVPVVL